MTDKCPYCGAQHYDEVERELAKLVRMQPVVDALGRYMTAIRSEFGWQRDDPKWVTVSETWDKYMEAEQCDKS